MIQAIWSLGSYENTLIQMNGDIWVIRHKTVGQNVWSINLKNGKNNTGIFQIGGAGGIVTAGYYIMQ